MIRRDLLGIEDLEREDIERILETAVRMQEEGLDPITIEELIGDR